MLEGSGVSVTDTESTAVALLLFWAEIVRLVVAPVLAA